MKDVYLQPHAPDPVLSDALVLRLARRHVPRADHVLDVDESGGEARTYAVDEGLVLKTQRPHRLRPRTSLRKEAFFLQQFAPQAGARVPTVLGYGHAEGVEYLLLTRVQGIPLREASLAPARRSALLEELGELLRRLHAIDQAPLAASSLFPADPPRGGLRTRVRTAFAAALERLAEPSARWDLPFAPDAVAERALALLPPGRLRCALHANPGPTHVFVAQDGSLSGLIDFADAFIGHPAHDLRRFGDPGDREAVLRGYRRAGPLDEEFAAVWTALGMLTDLTEIARADAAAEACRESLSRRLAGILRP